MEQLKHRIEEFEKQTDESDKTLLFFLIQNNNSFPFLFAGRKNLMDFIFALEKLKSVKIFLNYSSLQARRAIQALSGLPSLSGFRAFPFLSYFPNINAHSALLGLRDLLALRGLPYPPTFEELLKQYNKKYKSILIKHRHKIVQWTDQAMEKLHGMSDRRLLKYFPNTTKEELRAFRESYMEILANELSKGNCDILIGKKLTKKKQKRIEELVTFDEKSVERMLDFELDIPHEEEKHTHHLKAFEILGNKDYEKLYTIIRKFIRSHPDNSIRLHALYIFKNML
jgi:hypothetical protein